MGVRCLARNSWCVIPSRGMMLEMREGLGFVRSGIAQAVRYIGIGIAVLSLIGSIALAFLGMEAAQAIGEPWVEIAITTFLTGAVVSVVAGALIIGLSEIIELLAKIEYNMLVNAGIDPSDKWMMFKHSLTQAELRVLQIIIQAEDATVYLSEKGIQVDALINSINNKALDKIGDEVLDTSGELRLYKEYENELKASFI